MALTKLKYNGDSKIIKNLVDRINALIEGGGGASKLVDLTDTNISNPSNGQVLGYNSSSTKWVNMTITVPTKTSDLTNDSGFITSTVNNLTNYYLKTETYTQAEVNSLIGAITTISFEVVQTLPTSNIKTNVIYLVPKSTAGTSDVYDEYINMDGTSAGWEIIGSTQVDLSNYYTKSQTDTLLNGKVSDVKVNGTTVVNQNHVAEITSYKEVTQLEYDNLPSSKLTDGIAYFIKDGVPADDSIFVVIDGILNVIYDDGT